jgi:hypothetical protein
MIKLAHKILYLIFGEWNGIQIFIAPTVLLCLFNQATFINWFTGVLTYQRFYIPLFTYILILFSILFLTLKVVVQWQTYDKSTKSIQKIPIVKNLLIPYILKLHKWILSLLTIMMIVFIIKSGFVFFYRHSFPLFSTYFWILRMGTVLITLYTFALLEVAIPMIRKGKTLDRAQKYFHLLLIKRWKNLLPLYLVQLLWIYVSVLIFKLAIDQIASLYTLENTALKGRELVFVFYNVDNIFQFVINVLFLLLAFLLCNLLYSPLMFLIRKGLNRFNLTMRNL